MHDFLTPFLKGIGQGLDLLEFGLSHLIDGDGKGDLLLFARIPKPSSFGEHFFQSCEKPLTLSRIHFFDVGEIPLNRRKLIQVGNV